MSDILSMMNHYVTVEVGDSNTPDGAGAPKTTWSAVGYRVPCYIRQPNGSESKRWGRETTRNTLIGVFRSDLFVADQLYRIKWLSGQSGRTRTLDVQAQAFKDYDETGNSDYIELLLEETK